MRLFYLAFNKFCTKEKIDNNNPLDSVIGNAFIAHESVKASLALLLAGNES